MCEKFETVVPLLARGNFTGGTKLTLRYSDLPDGTRTYLLVEDATGNPLTASESSPSNLIADRRALNLTLAACEFFLESLHREPCTTASRLLESLGATLSARDEMSLKVIRAFYANLSLSILRDNRRRESAQLVPVTYKASSDTWTMRVVKKELRTDCEGRVFVATKELPLEPLSASERTCPTWNTRDVGRLKKIYYMDLESSLRLAELLAKSNLRVDNLSIFGYGSMEAVVPDHRAFINIRI